MLPPWSMGFISKQLEELLLCPTCPLGFLFFCQHSWLLHRDLRPNRLLLHETESLSATRRWFNVMWYTTLLCAPLLFSTQNHSPACFAVRFHLVENLSHWLQQWQQPEVMIKDLLVIVVPDSRGRSRLTKTHSNLIYPKPSGWILP